MSRVICDPGNGRICPNLAQQSCRGMCKKHYRAWLAVNPPVDGGLVAEHIAVLRESGLGWRRLSAATGVATSTLREIAIGKTSYCFAPTADAIFGIEPDSIPALYLNPVGAQRRLRALQALGYTDTTIAEKIGTTQAHLWHYFTDTGPKFITRALFDRADSVFRELAALPAPTGWTADRARRRAASRGWLPPLAWDEDTIDDPAAEPLVDAIRKPRSSRGIPEDFVDEYIDLRDEIGLSDERIADRLGITEDALYKRLIRRGITPQTTPQPFDDETEVAS